MNFIRTRLDLRIALLYALFGGAWILFSDSILGALVTDEQVMIRIAIYKGWAYVAVSALLIYFLVRREMKLRQSYETDLRNSEERYRLLFETSLDAILLTAPDGSIYAANPAACRMFERTEAEITTLGRNGIVDTADPRLGQALAERARTGRFLGEMTLKRRDGTPFEAEVSTALFSDSHGRARSNMIIRDIAARRQAEHDLRRLNRALSTVGAANQALVRAQDESELLREICRICVDVGGYRLAWVGLAENDPGKSVRPAASQGVEAGYLESLNISWAGTPQGGGPTGTAIRTGQPQIIHNIAEDPSYTPWRDAARRQGYNSSIALPLMGGGVVFGALNIYAAEADAFDTAELELLSELAADLVYGMTALRERVERAAAQQALAENEQRLRVALKAVDVAVFSLDRDLRYTWMYSPQLGYTPEEVIGHTDVELLPPGDGERVMALKRGVLESGRGVHQEVTIHAPDRTLYFDMVVEPLRDTQGAIAGLSGATLDITQRKHVDEQVAYQAFLLNHVNDAVIGTDDTFNIVSWNPGAEALYGWMAAEVLGRPMPEVTQSQLVGERRTGALRTLADTGQLVEEVYHLRRDGRRLALEVKTSALHGPDGRLSGYVTINRDITARKEAADAAEQYAASLERAVAERTADLQRLNSELRQANRAKDEFLAAMSHELRTPLGAILALSESFEEGTYGALAEIQHRPMRTITESGRHLLGLINDILDLAKIEAGRFELHPEPVELEAVCAGSLNLVRGQAQHGDLTVEYKPALTAKRITLDSRALTQILVNLLGNAVKFTQPGGRIGLEVKADAEHSVIAFTVWDTGIGIAPQDIARLFKPFVQLDSGLSRRYGGTGLGLALVYQLTELQGGSVALESALGRGSRFTITLPWRAAAAEPAHPAEAPGEARGAPAESVYVLVVDDNVETRSVYADFLISRGCRVGVAANGQEALTLMRAERPDVVLMDIQMPVMDGLEAIRQIRADSALSDLPVVALTALAMPGDRDRCFEAGASDYIAKPAGLARLLTLIHDLAGRAAEARPA